MLARTREVVNYRELLKNLVTRDLKVRYRNSFLGILWSMLNPLLMMLVYVFVFTQLLKNSAPAVPRPGATLQEVKSYMVGTYFPVFILTGLLPWNWFASAIMGSITSVVGNSHLIKKVYFPRELLPVSVVLSNLVNFLLSFPVLLLFIFIIKPPTVYTIGNYIWLPVLFLTQTILLSGLAFFFSALNVYFRDTLVIMEVGITAWFFLTPVIYDSNDVWPGLTGPLYWINPMASLISNYRDILFWNTPPDPLFMARTLLTSTLILVLGYAFFVRFSKRFGEEL